MSEYSTMSITEFFEKVFIGVLNTNYKATSQSNVRVAVASFNKWYGCDPLVGDIDVDLLERYQAENKQPKCLAYCNCLWRVMRAAAPKRFPKRRGKPKARKIPTGTDGPHFFLSAFYAKVYEPNALRSRRPNTKRLYRTTLVMFETFLNRPPTLDDMTDENINRFAAWRLSRGLSKFTVNKDLFNLLAMWRWANRKGYIEEWPDVSLEKPPKESPIAWTREELDKLFKSAGEETGRISGVPASVWWTALLLVFWDTGERVSAVRSLIWKNVDTKGRWVRFSAEDRKGGAADNTRRIAKDTAAKLASVRRWQETEGSYSLEGEVFPWAFSSTYIYRCYEKILQRAGLPHDAKHKFHCLRKTVASHYEQAGGNATELLCHSKREITKSYLDPRVVLQTEAIDLLFRPDSTMKKRK